MGRPIVMLIIALANRLGPSYRTTILGVATILAGVSVAITAVFSGDEEQVIQGVDNIVTALAALGVTLPQGLIAIFAAESKRVDEKFPKSETKDKDKSA